MAILSGKYKQIPIALIMSACFVCYALAADTAAQKTQPSAEVFDIKEKDLPVADVPAAPNNIPPPDFKEFEDDKLIDNLMGEDKKPDAAATKNADAVPAPEIPKIDENAKNDATSAAMPPVNAPATEPVALPVPEEAAETAAAPVAPTAVSAEVATPATTPAAPLPTEVSPVTGVEAETQSAGAEKPQGEVATPTSPADAAAQKQVAMLTDEEKASYAELRKHLNNFVASFHGKVAGTELAVAKEEPAKTPEVASGEAPVTDEVKTAEPLSAGKEVAPDVAAVSTVTPEVTKPAEAPDEFADLLGSDAPKEATALAKPQPAKPEVIAKPQEVAKPETPTKIAEAAPVVIPVPSAPTEVKAAHDAKSIDKAADVVEALPAPKPKEVHIDEKAEPQQQEREKPSEADKAYFKLLDKKRDNLPESKRLSDATKTAMDDFANILAPVKKSYTNTPKHINLEHGKTGTPGVEEDGVTKSQSKMDISVRSSADLEKVEKSKAKLDTAYRALLAGQISASINIYKEVLAREPNNKDAMFGLATAYHKNSQFEQARAIYTDLLKKQPNNKEALNNFLVLVAEEAPEDALIELEKLERVNSDFSPIPAQIAMISLKLGNPEKAARYLRRAILLSPENMSYKYNLAITYDKMGKDVQALQLYHQIVDAARDGAAVSGSINQLKARMAYLDKKIRNKDK